MSLLDVKAAAARLLERWGIEMVWDRTLEDPWFCDMECFVLERAVQQRTNSQYFVRDLGALLPPPNLATSRNRKSHCLAAFRNSNEKMESDHIRGISGVF